MPEIVQERTIEQRITAIEEVCEQIRAGQIKLLESTAIEEVCEQIRADQIKLLEGIAKFFAMAEQMKSNPLFSALMPSQAPPQRKR